MYQVQAVQVGPPPGSVRRPPSRHGREPRRPTGWERSTKLTQHLMSDGCEVDAVERENNLVHVSMYNYILYQFMHRCFSLFLPLEVESEHFLN